MSYGTEEEKKCVAEYELEDLKTAGLLKSFNLCKFPMRMSMSMSVYGKGLQPSLFHVSPHISEFQGSLKDPSCSLFDIAPSIILVSPVKCERYIIFSIILWHVTLTAFKCNVKYRG